MIAEALKYLTDLGTKSTAPVELKADPRRHRYAIGGEIQEFGIPASPRQHQVDSLEEITDLAERFAATDSCKPVVWYDGNQVVLVLDDDGHRIEKATLSLEESDVFTRVVSLRQKQAFGQKAFIKLLRIDLARTLEPVVLLEKVRRVKFENGMATTGEIRRNQESLGRTITSKVETDTELPEEVALAVPVYKTLGETDPILLRCAVEVDPGMGEFQLIPLPDEIERVRHLAVGSIRDRLSELLPETVPFYFGRP